MNAALAAAVLTLAAVPQEIRAASDRGAVDVVFCIDRSGSMQQVIDTAKRKVWGIVNEIARSKPTPRLRIGLIGYGSADRDIKFFPLSDDLDKVYENLVTFKTDMGGDEWVGWALRQAVERMEWTTEKRALKVIFLVGNETALQGRADVHYTKTAPEAIARDVMVNAVYCGRPNPEEERTWREVASLADGAYSVIDLSGGAVTIDAPQDQRILELNGKLNATYVAFGREGGARREKQAENDRKAEQLGGAADGAARAAAKASPAYRQSAWDLVDALKDKSVDLASVKEEELPAEMKGMTAEERKVYVEKKAAERAALQAEIHQLSVERQKHVDAELKARNLTQDGAFDEAVKKTIRAQAEKKGFEFGK